MRFLHVETDESLTFYEAKSSDEFKFIKPTLKNSGCNDTSGFNVYGALYLSKATDDDSSMWLKYREHLLKRSIYEHDIKKKNFKEDPDYYEEMGFKLPEHPDPWLYNSKKHFFEIDFEKDGIYVIDTPCQLRDFFLKYGKFSQKILNYQKSEKEKERDIIRLKKYHQLKILDKFIDELDVSYKKLISSSKFEKIKEYRNKRNMPIIKFTNRIIIPKKGISFEFLVDIIRTKEDYIKFIGDVSQLLSLDIRLKIDSIKFKDMAKDGYNGIYYSTNLVKFVSDEEIESLNKKEGHKIEVVNFIQPIDIGEFPDVYGCSSKFSLKWIKEEIENYIRWLGSDTLIMWNM